MIKHKYNCIVVDGDKKYYPNSNGEIFLPKVFPQFNPVLEPKKVTKLKTVSKTVKKTVKKEDK